MHGSSPGRPEQGRRGGTETGDGTHGCFSMTMLLRGVHAVIDSAARVEGLMFLMLKLLKLRFI